MRGQDNTARSAPLSDQGQFVHNFFAIGAALFIFGAIGEDVGERYQSTRQLIASLTGLGLALAWWRRDFAFALTFLVIALLFNPLVPPQFQDNVWHGIHLLTGCIFLRSVGAALPADLPWGDALGPVAVGAMVFGIGAYELGSTLGGYAMAGGGIVLLVGTIADVGESKSGGREDEPRVGPPSPPR